MKSITYYHLVLDASGSMNSVRQSTIEAVNQQLKSIRDTAEKHPDQQISITLTLFNTSAQCLFSDFSPEKAPYIGDKEYRPDGGTALLDALGARITETEHKLRPQDDVVLVVITDGEENASQYFTFQQVAHTIERLKKTERWSFSFIGADLDAWSVAGKLNFSHNEVIQVDKDAMQSTFLHLNEELNNYMERKSKGEKLGRLYDKG